MILLHLEYGEWNSGDELGQDVNKMLMADTLLVDSEVLESEVCQHSVNLRQPLLRIHNTYRPHTVL